MNIFTFTGNLGKDCEVRATQSGTTVASFSAAVKSGFGQNEKTTWVQCVMFGKKAEGQLPNYLKKGTQVAISGELTLEEWQGNDGQTNKAVKVVVNELDLIGGNPNQQQAPQQNGWGQASAPQPPQQQAPQQQWGTPTQTAPQQQVPVQQNMQPPQQQVAPDDIPF